MRIFEKIQPNRTTFYYKQIKWVSTQSKKCLFWTDYRSAVFLKAILALSDQITQYFSQKIVELYYVNVKPPSTPSFCKRLVSSILIHLATLKCHLIALKHKCYDRSGSKGWEQIYAFLKNNKSLQFQVICHSTFASNNGGEKGQQFSIQS